MIFGTKSCNVPFGRPGTHYVAQTGFEFMVTFLSPPLRGSMLPHA